MPLLINKINASFAIQVLPYVVSHGKSELSANDRNAISCHHAVFPRFSAALERGV